MPSNLELTKLSEQMETLQKLITEKVKSDPSRSGALQNIISVLGDRLALAPSSTRTEYQGCFMGGLVHHSLKVVKLMAELNKTYTANLTPESIVMVGAFHDLGKVGTREHDYYVPKNSDWHNRQGIMYETNQDLVNMPVSLRSLCLLQEFGVKLTEEEHYAISSIKDRSRPGEESFPVANEPMLAVILSQAVRVACIRGRGLSSVLDK